MRHKKSFRFEAGGFLYKTSDMIRAEQKSGPKELEKRLKKSLFR